ncbi:hypothetical protein AVEN_93577-1 [Araneus ventricosus]|uniref:Uncharacterized protein n=1 Tax=Araneus ventricosus TaxID=182803 RepID=A0A4Y2ARN3_ARAVE|nr:hypothetical protein AVEN_93577-1 [Araneus ventricosus]
MPLLRWHTPIRRNLHEVFFGSKSGPFQGHFQLGEGAELTRSHVGRLESLMNRRYVVFGQLSIKCKEWAMGDARCPQIRPFEYQSVSKAIQNLFVEGLQAL